MTGDPDQAAEFQESISLVSDDRLVAQLDATARIRGDGRHLEFVSIGMIRREPE